MHTKRFQPLSDHL